MKKLRCYIVTVFISLCIAFCGLLSCEVCVLARAEEETLQDRLNQTIQEQIDHLDLEDLETYLTSLGNFSNESLSERLFSYIQTGGTDYEGIWKQIKTILFSKITEVLPAFVCITAITLLSGLISMLKSGSNLHTASDVIFLITYAAALIPLLSILSECFRLSVKGIQSMQTQMQLIFPLILTLMAATGGTATAAVCRPAVAFFSNNIVTVVHSVIFPITGCILVLSMATNLTKELKIGKFTAFFKSINKWIVGICISAFGIFFTLQGITAANYDGIVRRAAKYAIGNGIPIVGGFLSGGFDLAVAGSVLIKNALGSMSIFLMITVIFEPLILLLSSNILLRLTAAITQPFGDGRISDFLEETAGNLHYCTAGLLFTAFLYFLSIMLIVCASEALF